ncbi:MAG: hypothetical protein FK731_02615 [Asgard group archaeon]|nr:hypothetical protein [Asgard group archaeon]
MLEANEARTALMDTKIRKSQITIRLIIWSIVPIVTITLGLAWAFYPESYEFIYEFISNFGRFYSFDLNLDNTTSMFIMSIGFGMIGFVSLIIAIFYFIRPVLKYNNFKGLLYIILFFGAIGIAVPADHPKLNIMHNIGAILFIFGFGMINFVSQLLRFIRKHDLKSSKKSLDFYLDIVIVAIVFTVMILLGIFYLLNNRFGIITPGITAQFWQKILLIVDFVAIFFLDIDDM